MATKMLELKGGNKLQAKLAEIAARIGEKKQLNVGFLEDADYPATESGERLKVAQVAFWNEFGTSRAPPRPFFRNMIKAKAPRWGEQLAKIAKAQQYDGTKTMASMGELIKDQLSKSINDFSNPGNAPSTIKKKGFDKPLIDTGQMMRAVNFEVVEP